MQAGIRAALNDAHVFGMGDKPLILRPQQPSVAALGLFALQGVIGAPGRFQNGGGHEARLEIGKVVMALCIFTMYFSGGMIPTYLTIRNYNMLNTIWALILPGSLSVYNMIVMRTYFNTSIPDEMREAAQIDGCGEWRFLLQIVLPLSGPILAVIGLYYAVDLWNSYYGALLYISDKSKLPLANVLRELLVQSQSLSMESNVTLDSTTQALMEKRAEVMRYSLIIVSSLPVMCLYPFVQKYFVKGVMIGAVKG